MVKNNGRATQDVVEVYVQNEGSENAPKNPRLCAFKRVSLEAGEEKEVTFRLSKKELGFYLPDGNYTVEKGAFEIYIGKDCLADKAFEVIVN